MAALAPRSPAPVHNKDLTIWNYVINIHDQFHLRIVMYTMAHRLLQSRWYSLLERVRSWPTSANAYGHGAIPVD